MDTKEPFDRLVDVHGATVLRVARAVVGTSDADDVWSETFLSALRAYPSLPANANHEAWLVTIARRRAIDHLRARARRAVPVEDPGTYADPAPAPEPGGFADDRIPIGLQRLTARQRDAVLYHHVAGLAHAEIAELLGCSPAAARKASSDGVRALRRHLDSTTEASHV